MDPEAARVVLEGYKCPMTIVPLETFRLVYTPVRRSHVLLNCTYQRYHAIILQEFRKIRETKLAVLGTPQIELLNKVEKTNLSWVPAWSAADAVAAMAFIEPRVHRAASCKCFRKDSERFEMLLYFQSIKNSEKLYCTVELGGEFTRGMMVVERRWQIEVEPNATIITDIDLELYEQLVFAGAGSATEVL